MLKATAGGGGRGIRMVASPADLEDAFQRTSDEALRSFGNGTVFLERLVTGARHVEVQLIADSHGTAWALGVRDCSIQRRNQKVIEESSSPLLSDEQADELKAAAERLALEVGYVGAGTVEFLYHPGEQTFAFLEVNTRLQVEHSITELTTGVDLVKAQLLVAQGGRLEGEKPAELGHAIEARLNAEDPDRDFAPSPGHIEHLDLPSGPGIRVDTGVAEGDTIPPDFDSMIAKVIAYGRTRDEALARLRRAMSSTTVVIEGGACNKSFVLDLLAQPEVVSGNPRLGRHRLDRPGARRGPAGRPRARRRRCGRRRHRGLPRPGADRDRAALRDRARRPSLRLAPGGPARRAQAPWRAVPGVHGQHRPRPLPGERRLGRFRGTDRRRADGARRRRTPAPGRRGQALQHRHRHPRTDDARRGRRCRPPGQPRRGRRAALARAGPGRGHSGRRGCGGRSGCGRRRARVDEDGDGGARAVRGPRQGAARHDRQPGRDRLRADQAGAPRRRSRGGRGGDRPRSGPAHRRPALRVPEEGRSPVSKGRRARRPERRPPRLRRTAGGPGRRAVGVPRRPRADPGPDIGRGRVRDGPGGLAAGDLHRPRRADPQPSRGRGPADRAAGAQPARALPHLPAEPRRRARGAPGAVPRAVGARAPALRRRGRRPHTRAGGRGLPHLPGPAADDARGSARLRPAGLVEPRDPADRAARRSRPRGAGATRSRPAVALPGGRRPGPQRAVPLVRPAGGGRRALGHPPRHARRARRARRLDGRVGDWWSSGVETT